MLMIILILFNRLLFSPPFYQIIISDKPLANAIIKYIYTFLNTKSVIEILLIDVIIIMIIDDDMSVIYNSFKNFLLNNSKNSLVFYL